MTTLTPNRILQQGDEYRNNGTWKPVPKEDYGLQVMFTKYAEVRRPSEEGKPFDTRTHDDNGQFKPIQIEPPTTVFHSPPISPDSGAIEQMPIAKAEKEKTPAPTPSGAGDSSYLPTVISPKAHKEDKPRGEVMMTHSDPMEPPALNPSTIANVKFPPASGAIWTGRNGTFVGYGLELMNTNDLIMVSPIGKRGIGNGCIQFPRAVIPEIVEWLQKQQTPK